MGKRTIKELQQEQKYLRKQSRARREGEIAGLLYAREKVTSANGITLTAAHNFARLIDRRLAELAGPEVV